MAGYITIAKGSAPSAPSSGYTNLYPDSEGRIRAYDATGNVNQIYLSDRPNYLRNSGFWFAQRQTPGSATNCGSTTTRGIGGDGWGVTNENANTTYQRTDTSGSVESGLQAQFYGSFVKVTSTGKFVVTQCLEGKDVCSLRGRTVRFQCLMKGTASQTVRLGLVQLNSSGTIDSIPATYISAFGANGTDPTLGTNLAYIAPKSGVTSDNCTTNGNAADCSVTTAWQRFGAVFDVPTTCKNLLVSLWTNAQLTATNGFSVAQASLTDGYELQDWSPMSYQDELDRVQRFYCKTFAVDTAPAQSAGVTGALRGGVAIAGAVATSSVIQWRFPVQMRAAPTLTFYNPSAANAFTRNVPRATDASATSSASVSADDANVNATGLAAWTVGDEINVHASADIEL